MSTVFRNIFCFGRLAYVFWWPAGAKLNAKGTYGTTPLDMIRYGRHLIDAKKLDECAKLLRKHGGKTGKELDAEAKQNKAKEAKEE